MGNKDPVQSDCPGPLEYCRVTVLAGKAVCFIGLSQRKVEGSRGLCISCPPAPNPVGGILLRGHSSSIIGISNGVIYGDKAEGTGLREAFAQGITETADEATACGSLVDASGEGLPPILRTAQYCSVKMLLEFLAVAVADLLP